VSGKYAATDETSSARWATIADLPELLPNQLLLLQKAGVIH
jgi:hypothetical protein